MAVMPNKVPDADVRILYVPTMKDLPEAERGWVRMDVSALNVRDIVYSIDYGDDKPGKISVSVLVERIKEWNFTEENSDEVLPINRDSVIRLGPINIDYLSDQIIKAPAGAALPDAEKKSSSSTSGQQPATAQ